MAVGMHKVAFPNAPGFIGWRPGHDQALLQRELISRIDVRRRRDPPTHPNSARIIVSHVPRQGTAAGSLSVLAEEYLAFSAANAAESRRITPVPAFFPAQFLKPGEALLDVGDVENWSQSFDVHWIDLL